MDMRTCCSCCLILTECAHDRSDVVISADASAQVDVNAQATDGLTSLHAALGGGFTECALMLIKHGAIGSLVDSSGKDAIVVMLCDTCKSRQNSIRSSDA
jgi:hypothetical protein